MRKLQNNRKVIKKLSLLALAVCSGLISFDVLAASGMSIGDVSAQITSSFTSVTNLITGGSYLGGLAFSIGAIMKFKQHKDNPTQIPIGTPIALLFIAAALLFLPSVLSTAGMTLFKGGSTSTPTGSVYSPTQG